MDDMKNLSVTHGGVVTSCSHEKKSEDYRHKLV